MTNEEMMKDIRRMNLETMATIKRSMEIFQEISNEHPVPEEESKEIKSLMQDILATTEENHEICQEIIGTNAFDKAQEVLKR